MNLHKASFKAATVLLKSKSSVEEGNEVSAENTKISESFAEFYTCSAQYCDLSLCNCVTGCLI